MYLTWNWAIGIVFFLCAQYGNAQQPGTVLSVEEIHQVASKQSQVIESLKVDYTVKFERLADVASTKDVSIKPCRIVFALKGDKRYLKYVPIDSEPGDVSREASFDGLNSLQYWSGSAIVENGKTRQCEELEFYVKDLLSIPYTDKAKISDDISWRYPHVLRPLGDDNKSKYTVLPAQEQIDGVWCQVIEYPNYDKIWVDTSLGCVIRRRIRTDASGIEDAPLFFRYELTDYVETAPGIWLPMHCQLIRYGKPIDGPAFRNKPVFRWVVNVDNAVVNSVEESDFSINLPPGTTVTRGDESFVVGGTSPVLIQQFGDISAKKYGQSLTPEGRRRWIFVWINFLIVVVLICCVIAARRHRSRSL
jgi:hypothetical protein